MTLDTTTTSPNVNKLIVIAAMGTAAVSPLSLEISHSDHYPTTSIAYEQLDNQQWDLDNENPMVSIDQIQTLQKIETLKSFSASIIENSQSLDDETIEIINKNFWDWIQYGS